jgi:hypothetical protein
MVRFDRPVACRDLVHEIIDQQSDVLAPLGQRRDADRHDREAVKQILTEVAGRDFRLPGCGWSRTQCDIDTHLAASANALEGLVR